MFDKTINFILFFYFVSNRTNRKCEFDRLKKKHSAKWHSKFEVIRRVFSCVTSAIIAKYKLAMSNVFSSSFILFFFIRFLTFCLLFMSIEHKHCSLFAMSRISWEPSKEIEFFLHFVAFVCFLFSWHNARCKLLEASNRLKIGKSQNVVTTLCNCFNIVIFALKIPALFTLIQSVWSSFNKTKMNFNVFDFYFFVFKVNIDVVISRCPFQLIKNREKENRLTKTKQKVSWWITHFCTQSIKSTIWKNKIKINRFVDSMKRRKKSENRQVFIWWKRSNSIAQHRDFFFRCSTDNRFTNWQFCWQTKEKNTISFALRKMHWIDAKNILTK